MTTRLTISPLKSGKLLPLIIAILAAAALALSVVSVSPGLVVLFQSLLHFPVILACAYYPKRGFVFSVVLACCYFLLMFSLSRDPATLGGAAVRVAFFVLVGWVVAYLSIIRIRAQDRLAESKDLDHEVVENTPNLIVICGSDRKIRFANPAAGTAFGYSTAEMTGTDIMAYVSESERTRVTTAMQEWLSSGSKREPLEMNLVTRGGQPLPVISRGASVCFAGEPAVLVLFTDISERKLAEEKLRAAHLQWNQFLDVSPDAMWIKDASGRYVAVNKTYGLIDPSVKGSVIGKTDAEVFPPEKAEVYVANDRIAIEQGMCEEEFTATGVDGKLRSFLTKKVVLRAADGSVAGTLGVSRDITDRKRSEEAIYNERLLLRTLIDNIPDSVYAKDLSCRKTLANAAEVRYLGVKSEAEALGTNDFDSYPEETARRFFDDDKHVMETGEPVLNREEYLTVADGRQRCLLTTKIPLRNLEGKIIGLVGIGRDITERKQMETQLEEMATHDFLTGLPNRRLLLDRFEIAAALAHRNKTRLAVMSLDLDQFKEINDTYGHDSGDQVLKGVGKRLSGSMRGSDTLARVGGDEFVALFLGEDVLTIAQRIVGSFVDPVTVADHQIQVSASVGIAVYETDGEDMETLISKSDAAMYCAKEHGGSQFRFFADGDVKPD
ncbi:MAG TPA: PAS domain-containing protein [Clostridia bacterium]|nr:PAS domain-containing protein [Clostridia bacterium]